MTLALAAGVAFGGLVTPSWVGLDGSSAFAQSKREAKAKPAKTGGLGDLSMARRLFAYGKQSGDARAMGLAAEIIEGFKGTETAEGGPKRKAEARAATGKGRMTVEGMREAATAADPAAAEAVRKKPAAVEEVEEVEEEDDGYEWMEGYVDGGSEEIWSWELVRGQYVEIGISGWSDADIDLYIIDPEGNDVCVSESETSEEYCEIEASMDGVYEIIVFNHSDFETSYELYWWTE